MVQFNQILIVGINYLHFVFHLEFPTCDLGNAWNGHHNLYKFYDHNLLGIGIMDLLSNLDTVNG